MQFIKIFDFMIILKKIIGYHFITSSSGTVNGNFLGIGADLMTIASVMVEGAQPAGD